MKYVLFHVDGKHIGTLQTEEVGTYQAPYIVLDALPPIMANVPADKIIMIDQAKNTVYLADKPKEPAKPKTTDEEIAELKQSTAELTMLVATLAGASAATTDTPTPAAK